MIEMYRIVECRVYKSKHAIKVATIAWTGHTLTCLTMLASVVEWQLENV